MSKEHDKDNPYITIGENVNSKALAIIGYGIPIALLILALPFPFFRHVFTFGSIIITVICCFAVYVAYEDKKNGVIRTRPTKKGVVLPKWLKTTFFLTMICLSAGLRLGFYIVPVCWLINWLALVSFQAHIEDTYKDEPKED